jgi:site-specific DNA-methyltransferase (adenine-specific)
MDELEDGSVGLVVTSPPYWQLKDYGCEEQLGFSDSYEEYINHLNLVWSECHRTLHDGCRLCINIGDQFARAAHYGRYKVIPIRTEIIRFCETIGFDYMGAIIWQKVTTTNTSGGGSIMGSFPFPRNGIVKLDYEFILLFKKGGKQPVVSAECKESSRMTTEEWNTCFSGHWNFPGEKQSDHLAAFPRELPRRLIKMFSMSGDQVLDPFLGSGTTSEVAAELGRHSVGYEINADFLPVINSRLVGLDVEIEKRAGASAELSERLAQLPYHFSDPVRCERKSDRQLLTYGSKIDGSEGNRPGDDLHSVTQISAPDSVVLETGQKVRLLGVKSLKRTRQRAEAHLEKLVGGRKVYLRLDERARSGNGVVWAYLYLQNRTPINRHLIRSGLVGVDISVDYRFKKEFLKERDRARP